MSRPYFGVTLVETLTVVGILVLLIALSFPAVQAMRESSRLSVCLNQMKQMGLALHQFEAALGHLPSTVSFDRSIPLVHWQVMLLPYLELSDLFHEIKSNLAETRTPMNNPHQNTTIPIFQCPADPDSGLLIAPKFRGSFAFTSYCGVAGISRGDKRDGVFPIRGEVVGAKIRFSEIEDGLSNTIGFGERPPNPVGLGFGRWLGSNHITDASIGVYENPRNISEFSVFDKCLSGPIGFRKGERGDPCSALHHWSYHSGGANFARMDSSVNLVPYSIDSEVLKQLATRNGGD